MRKGTTFLRKVSMAFPRGYTTKTDDFVLRRPGRIMPLLECYMLCSKRGKIDGPVRKNHSSLVANNPVQHQRTPFANFRNRSHLAVRKTHHKSSHCEKVSWSCTDSNNDCQIYQLWRVFQAMGYQSLLNNVSCNKRASDTLWCFLERVSQAMGSPKYNMLHN